MGALWLDHPEIERYVDIYFESVYLNWYKPEHDGRYDRKRIKARPCRVEDFGDTEVTKAYFHVWDGFSAVCPDIPRDETVLLEGDLGSMISQNLHFRITRCNSRDHPGVQCKSKEEIDDFIRDITVDTWALFEKMDFNAYDRKPVFTLMENFGTYLLDPEVGPNVMLLLRKHSLETEDSYMRLGQLSEEGTFFQIARTLNRPSARVAVPDHVYSNQLFLQPEQVLHQRSIYGVIDLLGDLGGVTEVIMILFGFFLYPISEHSFILKVSKKMFLGRTKDEQMFVVPDDVDGKTKVDDKKLGENFRNHRVMRMKSSDKVKLYLANKLGWLFRPGLWDKKEKFQKMYQTTQDRLETELNIVKIIRSLRDIKILMKNSLMTPELKQMIRHTDKNLIDLDDTASSADEQERPDQPANPEEGPAHFEAKQTTEGNAIIANMRNRRVYTRKKSLKHMTDDEKLQHISELMKGSAARQRAGRKLTREEAATIITRWARERVQRMREVNADFERVSEKSGIMYPNAIRGSLDKSSFVREARDPKPPDHLPSTLGSPERATQKTSDNPDADGLRQGNTPPETNT